MITQAQRPETVRVVLPVEFLGAHDLGVGDSHVAPGDRHTGLDVADEGALVHIVAAFESIAVKEDVAADQAAAE